MSDIRKASPPETREQVREWERARTRYADHGLCHRCAAQAAWAHQDRGDTWTTIHPPCKACAPVVATFPHPTPSPEWRKTVRNRAPKVSVPDDRPTHKITPSQPLTDASELESAA